MGFVAGHLKGLTDVLALQAISLQQLWEEF